MNGVWVTGMGIACAHGSSLEGVAEAQREGRSGARPLAEAFDNSAFEIQAACRVPDWDLGPKDPGGSSGLGHYDLKRSFGLHAARKALLDAFGQLEVPASGDRIGIHLASGLVSTPIGEAEQDLLPAIDAGGRYDHPRAARLLERSSPWRARHFTDLANSEIAHWTGARGPSLVNHGACAASARAIGLAAEWIRRGRCDVVVAGGYESMIHPFGVLSFQMLGALSERQDAPAEAISRPFDLSRDGFVIGEGGAVLILESEEHARARGAQCWGRILGSGSSMDAHRVTAPPEDGRGAAEAMRRALDSAGVAPSDIGYINAHGTGTALNDVIETRAIKSIFGNSAACPPVSSSKSALGHSVAAAGAVEAVLSLLAARDQILPPTLNLHNPDPDCDLDYVPLDAREQTPGTILSNSFGFGGVNCCLVLEGGSP